MRIAVVGAGAIGCLFGARLQLSGQTVLLAHHNKQTVVSIRRDGVILREPSGKICKTRLQVKQSLSKDDHPELVLLTVKAYDTEGAARQLKRSIGNTSEILSLQNGLGNVETLSRFFPSRLILAGVTTEAALQTKPGRVTHTGKGFTWIGKYKAKPGDELNVIKKTLGNAGFRTEVSGNIEGVIWSKAIVNSVINPISALTGVPNGELIRNQNLRRAALELADEGVNVAKAHGVSPTPIPRSLLSRVLSSSRRNRSSMLRDIEAGRKTEVRQLNGWIASMGKRLGMRAPYNALVTMLVLGLEAARKRA